jgi:hypothetical protein
MLLSIMFYSVGRGAVFEPYYGPSSFCWDKTTISAKISLINGLDGIVSDLRIEMEMAFPFLLLLVQYLSSLPPKSER